MKLILIYLAMVAYALGESNVLGEKSVEEPQELTKLRDSWSYAKEEAIKPLNDKYANALTALKNRFLKAGKLEEAVAVDNELKALRAATDEKQTQAEQSPKTSRVSIQSFFNPNLYVQHSDNHGFVRQQERAKDKSNLIFEKVTGLAGDSFVSFRSVDNPNAYLAHGNYRVKLGLDNKSQQYYADASFKQEKGLANSGGVSFEASNIPGYYLYAKGDELWIAKNDDTKEFKAKANSP